MFKNWSQEKEQLNSLNLLKSGLISEQMFSPSAAAPADHVHPYRANRPAIHTYVSNSYNKNTDV